MIAKYYDQVYKNKDYEKESAYVHGLIGSATSVLDLGCGTGRHSEYFLKRDIAVQGIDADPEMIKIGRHRIPCAVGDVRTHEPYRKFDAVIALFHVASYMSTYQDLCYMFGVARRALYKDGTFVFDFWYGPAVLESKPEKKAIIVDDGVHRFTVPTLHINDNIVDVDHLWVIDEGQLKVTDSHKMRYWFLPELKQCLTLTGFEFVNAEAWLTGGELDDNSWYGCVVARKK